MNKIRENAFTNCLFALFVVAGLVTPSWRYGPFSWWPLGGAQLHVAGGPVKIGLLNLLPVLTILFWAARVRRVGSWQWGVRQITIPLVLYSLWSSIRLLGAPPRYVFIYGGNLILAWFVYLFLINQKPRLFQMLAIVMLVQSIVGIVQFLLQRDLGFRLFGELPLNPQFAGVSVIDARGDNWLRAYGLTAHPNLYGALLAACMALIFLRPWARFPADKLGVGILAGTGLVALFVSFSRAAWLGLGAAVTVWLAIRWRQGWRPPRRLGVSLVLLLIPLSLMLLFYGDLAVNRFTNLENPLEARSINERLSDARLALRIFLDHPWAGVGYGRYLDTAASISVGAARVHNVLLLTAAELGLPGLLAVIWLLTAPPLALFRLYRQGSGNEVAFALSLWMLVVFVNQLDTTLWISGNWQTAMLFALIAGQVSNLLTAPDGFQSRQLHSGAVGRNE